MITFWIVIGLVIIAAAAGIWAALPLFSNISPYLFPDTPSDRGMGRMVRGIIIIAVGISLIAALIIWRIYGGD
jgi:hypothetical protein